MHQTLRVTPGDGGGLADHVCAIEEIVALPENMLVLVERLRQQAEEFQRTVEEELRTARALLEELHIRQAKGEIMEDEWTKVISGHRLVKFTYLDLPDGTAFLTAQIAGHDVVYSVILRHAEHLFNREGVERRFAYECPPIST